MAPQIVRTSAGEIECEVQGSGTPVVVIHGSPSGIDGSLIMARFLPHDRFQTICYSRPGYLGTPLATDNSFDREAHLVAALLDQLRIEKVAVFAWSGGGAPAYRFAVCHSDRVTSMVTFAACSSTYVVPDDAPWDGKLLSTRLGVKVLKALAKYAPEKLVAVALENEGNLHKDELRPLIKSVMADPDQWKVVVDTAVTTTTIPVRRPGWDNDLANYGAIISLELEKIQCPVLLIHGDADTDAIPEYSKTAHAAIPDSELLWMKRGTHLAFYAHPDAKEMQEVAKDWLMRGSVGAQ